MIVKTGLINKTDRIGTIGKKDMGASMTGIDLTSSNRHKQLTDTSIICIIFIKYGIGNCFVLSVVQGGILNLDKRCEKEHLRTRY